jgi:hypothetical protein
MIKVPSALDVAAGLEMETSLGIVLQGRFDWSSAAMAVDTTDARLATFTPTKIKTTMLGGSGDLGYRLMLGGFYIGALGGFGYQIFSGPEQSPVLLVPSWKRWSIRTTLTTGYGDLGRGGFSTQLEATLLPYGNHKESPLTSGASSKLFGGIGRLRLRYMFAELLGPMGLFIEAEGSFEYLKLTYKGEGTRTNLTNDDTIRRARETRLSYGGALLVGVAF